MKRALFCCFLTTFSLSFRTVLTDNPTLTLTAIIVSRSNDRLSLNATLTNNTSDTLKYMLSNHCLQDYYVLTNDKWQFVLDLGYVEGYKILSIPPHQSQTTNLSLCKVTGLTKSRDLNFKIGFHFIPPVELKNIHSKLQVIKGTGYTVWSDVVTPYFILQK